MAILKFSDKDKLASATMPAGYYSAEVVSIGEPKKSDSGKSFNILGVFKIIESDKFTGKELKVTFNTNMSSPSVLGSFYLMPHTYLLHVAAATHDVSLDEVPDDLDTDSMLGIPLDIRVEKVISEGVPVNTISGFLPHGKGVAADTESAPF
jgi:hypothetical protein